MAILVCLVLAIAFSFALRVPIKKAPWLFYLLAVAVDVLVIWGEALGVPAWLNRTFVTANGRCLFAFGLFVVVMFIGVLPEGSRARRWLAPIRAELSVIASILAVGHVVRYLGVYSMRVLTSPGALANGTIASFVVALVIAVLLVLLAVTSLRFVKRHMGARGWKRLQRLAYPFFVLIYVHVGLIMARPALAGAENAIVSLAVYGVITLAYVVLRLLRWRCDARKSEAGGAGSASGTSRAGKAVAAGTSGAGKAAARMSSEG